MRRRRRRRNPEPVTLLILGGIAVAGAAFFLLKKRPQLVTTTGQSFTPSTDTLELGAFKTAEGILAGDCILAKNGQGFTVGGVPIGENTPLEVTRSAGIAGASVVARSIDPRSAGETVNVPVGAISGAGECGVGFG